VDFNFVHPSSRGSWSKTAKNISIRCFPAGYNYACNLAHRLRVCRATKAFIMKKNSLLSFVLLAVLATGASAAQSPAPSDTFDLPTYVVETERYAEAEQYINASLEALRAQAAAPVAVTVELPALKTQVAQSARPLTALRVAKS
jgi:hypothetical protein